LGFGQILTAENFVLGWFCKGSFVTNLKTVFAKLGGQDDGFLAF